jgi:hypothetical protein
MGQLDWERGWGWRANPICHPGRRTVRAAHPQAGVDWAVAVKEGGWPEWRVGKRGWSSSQEMAKVKEMAADGDHMMAVKKQPSLSMFKAWYEPSNRWNISLTLLVMTDYCKGMKILSFIFFCRYGHFMGEIKTNSWKITSWQYFQVKGTSKPSIKNV